VFLNSSGNFLANSSLNIVSSLFLCFGTLIIFTFKNVADFRMKGKQEEKYKRS